MNNNHILKHTHVGEVLVSTISLVALDLEYVWLVDDLEFNHKSMSELRRGLDFETMVFGPGDHNEQYRYATVEEALQHHDELVKQLELIEGS